MIKRSIWLAVVAAACLTTGAVRAEQSPPRDLWPQVAAAADGNDIDTAIKRTTALIETGRGYGIKTYPLYAASAAALSRQEDKAGNKDVAAWAAKAADQLDPNSPAVAFSNADHLAEQRNWAKAVPAVLTGFMRMLRSYRAMLLTHCDLMIVLSVVVLLTAALFALALFIRYARSMGHDYREALGARLHGGAVSVLAFALLFLPIFFWLGPMWLIFYWFVIFFGYATGAERVAIIILALLVAVVPIVLDFTATRIAAVDSPVVMAAIASNEQSYQPETLRRLQELVALVPDDPTLQLLLGNLQLQEGNESQAQLAYRKSADLHDSAGAHVNLGNLHFIDNDFAAAITEYERAEQLDAQLAIAFYNNSIASGEIYKFDEQGQKLEQAKKIDRVAIEKLSQNPPAQKVVIYRPSLAEAWQVATTVARRGVARSLFGSYAFFDARTSFLNPITLGALLSIVLAVALWTKRRKSGYAGSCIKCGRTFCHLCKSSRESATYCTQCIHIYLKRDGVSIDTKRAKLDEVHDFHNGMQVRNRIFATFLPGTAQALEGRTIAGLLGMIVFLFFVCVAVFVGRLAPALGPGAEMARLLIRGFAIIVAVVIWLFVSLPVYRRRAVVN